MTDVDVPLHINVPSDPFLDEERRHVIACIDLFLSHLRRVADQYSVAILTNHNEIKYSIQDGLELFALDVRLDCDYFRVDMSVEYQHSMYGHDESEIYFAVVWQNINIKVDRARNTRYYAEKGQARDPFLNSNSESLNLFSGRNKSGRNILDDFVKVRWVAWQVLSKLRRLFIFSALYKIPYDVNSLLRTGVFDLLPSEVKSMVSDKLIQDSHKIYDEIRALETEPNITTPRSNPF